MFDVKKIATKIGPIPEFVHIQRLPKYAATDSDVACARELELPIYTCVESTPTFTLGIGTGGST